LATPARPTVATVAEVAPAPATSRTPAGEYQPAVEQALEAVRAGEVFQIQIGQRFSVPTSADPLDVYRVLRTLNPSPYMYFLRTADVDIVGSSPEALVTVTAGRAVLHPIAGTRKRGETAERDAALAASRSSSSVRSSATATSGTSSPPSRRTWPRARTPSTCSPRRFLRGR
jgi:anthranilate synthase component 1